MKLGGRSERPRSLRAREVVSLDEPPERPVREVLDFIQPGDEDLLDQGCADLSHHNASSRLSALACLRLLYPEHGRTPNVGLVENSILRPWVVSFTEILEGQILHPDLDLLKMIALRVFPALGTTRDDLPLPSSETWKVLVEDINEALSTIWNQSKISCLTIFPAIDFRAFEALDQAKMKRLVDEELSDIRRLDPIAYRPKQLNLLHTLSKARRVFPNDFGPQSVTQKESRAMRSTLEDLRTTAQTNNNAARQFPSVFFDLSILMAPQLIVNQHGISLPPAKRLFTGQPIPPRSVV